VSKVDEMTSGRVVSKSFNENDKVKLKRCEREAVGPPFQEVEWSMSRRESELMK
jgi:hypothetical protein